MILLLALNRPEEEEAVRRALAIREFEEALRIRPGFEQARANLARARAGG